jgi:hypothetical protein
VGIVLGVMVAASTAAGYIHFPPMQLPKMCKVSHHIRLLKVEKHSKEKGVILFEIEEKLKGQKAQITSFKHILGRHAEGTRPILDWVADGKTAVMFFIESPGGALGVGYVFIDNYCYSVDYNRREKYWLLIRAEPGLSACYYGSVGQLRDTVKAILDGKEVKVPMKEPGTKEDRDQRNKEINDVLKKNR